MSYNITSILTNVFVIDVTFSFLSKADCMIATATTIGYILTHAYLYILLKQKNDIHKLFNDIYHIFISHLASNVGDNSCYSKKFTFVIRSR